MPTLEKQAKEAIIAIENRLKRASRTPSRYPMQMERDIVILWGMYRGWSNPVIADALRCSTKTVERFRHRLLRNPGLIFLCPVLHKEHKGGKPLWRCEVCSVSMSCSEPKAREHVIAHILSRVVLR